MRAWLAAAALAAVLVQRLVRDNWLQRHCDTTYLWEGYEEAFKAEGSPYRLVRFKDGDVKRLADYQKLQQLQVLPVLFVHGHKGTHQQMRSAASETGRELARRLAANASWPLWLQWYGTDFNSEPSAMGAGLLHRQAGFVLQCIKHLQKEHGSSSSGGQHPTFRLLLVGYSMGGVVARHAVHELAADPTFDIGQLVALVTLGSPSHFPRFMPSTHPQTLVPSLLKPRASRTVATHTKAAAAAAAAAVPRVNIVAGPGDHSLPQTHTSAAPAPPPSPSPEGQGPGGELGLSLSMRDVPSVWTTCSHKGIVSCNQLLRQLVPLLADAALLALQPEQSSLAERQAAVRELMQDRLASNVGRALGWPDVAGDSTAGSSHPTASRLTPACAAGQAFRAAAEVTAPAEHVQAALTQRQVKAGRVLLLSWDAAELRQAGWHGLLLLATAAPPCSHLAIEAAHADGSRKHVAMAAAPLPPLLPSQQQRWVPRHWQRVMDGIDWEHNATRLLYLPLAGEAGKAGQQLAQVRLAAVGSTSGGTSITAQLLGRHPSKQAVQLSPPGASADLPANHAAAVALRLPHNAWPLSSKSCLLGSGQAVSLHCLALLLLGTTPPWRLRIQLQHCGDGASSDSSDSGGAPSSDVQEMLPLVVAVQPSGAPAGDSVRIAASSTDAAATGGYAAVPLWDGVAPLDSLLLITRPACAYKLRLEWDVAGWLGLSLRHLLLVLPALCMAISQSRLSLLPGSTARVAACAAAVAAWGSQHPQVLHAATGIQPWLQLSVVEVLAALLLAVGGADLWRCLLLVGPQLLCRVLPARPLAHAKLLGRTCMLAGLAGSLVHPALPMYLGCVCLAVWLAASSKQRLRAGRPVPPSNSSGSGSGSGRSAAGGGAGGRWEERTLLWLTLYSQLALLPTATLYAWLTSSSSGSGSVRQSIGWSSVSALAAGLAVHAILLCRSSRCDASVGGKQCWRAGHLGLLAAVHEAAACAGAAASLWGHPYATFHAVCASAVADALLGS